MCARQVAESAVNASIKIDIVPTNYTVAVYASVCRSGSCTAADATPTASSATWVVLVPLGGTSLFIAHGDPDFCVPSARSACIYHLAVAPTSAAAGTVVFQIQASVQDGTNLQNVRYADVANGFAVINNVVPALNFTRYELWLGGAAAPTANVYLYLEVCSGVGNAPSLSTCNASCADASHPYAVANNGKLGHTSEAVGFVGAVDFAVPAPQDVLYVSVGRSVTGGGARGTVAGARPWCRLPCGASVWPVFGSFSCAYAASLSPAPLTLHRPALVLCVGTVPKRQASGRTPCG